MQILGLLHVKRHTNTRTFKFKMRPRDWPTEDHTTTPRQSSLMPWRHLTPHHQPNTCFIRYVFYPFSAVRRSLWNSRVVYFSHLTLLSTYCAFQCLLRKLKEIVIWIYRLPDADSWASTTLEWRRVFANMLRICCWIKLAARVLAL